MKRILITILFVIGNMFLLSSYTTFAAGDDEEVDDAGMTIIPEGTPGAGETVGSQPGKVIENYRNAGKGKNAGDAFASGVFSWDSIFDFFKYLASFLSNIGLVIGAGMIIYAGYKYAVGVFTGDASKGGQDALKGAIYGVLIVIFSYAIMKVLLSVFL